MKGAASCGSFPGARVALSTEVPLSAQRTEHGGVARNRDVPVRVLPRRDSSPILANGEVWRDPGALSRLPWRPKVIAPGPTLETARLVLRPIALEDLDGFATLIGDPESARFLGGLQPRSVAWRAMSAMAGSWALQGFSMFSV